MKKESIFTIILAILVLLALIQTYELSGLKTKITSNVVKETENSYPEAEQTLEKETNMDGNDRGQVG